MMPILWFLAGLVTGGAHIALLRWNTQLYLSGGLAPAVSTQLLRLTGVGILLSLAAWNGAGPLLQVTFGVMLSRFLVLHLTKAMP